jgi:non-heme chloroperoxidase
LTASHCATRNNNNNNPESHMTITPRTVGEDNFCELDHGLHLCYRTDGHPTGEPLLLITGLGQQLIAWPQALVDDLVARGFYVIRFDNRDAGRSSRVPVSPPGRVRQIVRRFPNEQYTLGDMARDTIGLLDHLELDRVHLVGTSMGGMIAQTVAAGYPERVTTLTSISSSTGHWYAGRMAPSTMMMMLRPRPADRQGASEWTVKLFRHIGSRGYAIDEGEIRATALHAFDRGDGAAAGEGLARQVGAIYKTGDRTRELRRILAPTLVIHGGRDPMVHPSGGAATAAAIPGARSVTIDGMGHDLPGAALPRLGHLIAQHADTGRGSPGAPSAPDRLVVR